MVIYFPGDGIYFREVLSGGREVIINCLEDASDGVNVSSGEDEVFICEIEDIADAGEGVSDEAEVEPEGG